MSKIKREIQTHNDFPLQVAGRIWNVGKVTLTKNARGEFSIALDDLIRYQKAVANHICGEEFELTYVEFEFLITLTKTKKTEVEEFLRLGKGTVTKWKERTQLSWAESIILKKWFWRKIFGEADNRNPSTLPEELRQLESFAIKRNLAKPVKVAS